MHIRIYHGLHGACIALVSLTMCSSFLVLYLLVAAAYAAPRPNLTPTVTLDNGTFTGTTDGVSDIFRGIKFADAP